MIFILKFIVVMVCVGLGDMCWAKYMMYAADKKAFKAAFWGTLIMVFGMVSIISYLEDKRFIPAALIGGFIGTYYTVKHQKNVDTK